ncbi:MAG: glucose-1-phosphate adenylyltransferase subunit GlgD [Clostridia bacterium]|nr:glucose-1-phosphate adenylyltransferase subunit GlgD [Clostridia bacterium]
MKNAFALIYTGDASMQIRELTFSRSVAAVPFGGRYRIIDFMLSNLVNTGIYNVGVIAQKNYHSLMDHIESGKEWDLHRKRDGLFVLPPFVTHDNTGVYRGTVDALRSCMGYIRRSEQDYVVLTGSHTIYNTTFSDMIEAHINSDADITIMYNEDDSKASEGPFDDLRLQINENGYITDLELNNPKTKKKYRSCDAFVMRKDTLEYLVEDTYSHARYDFTNDVLVTRSKELRLKGWYYGGYVGRLNSVVDYYKHNMALLDKSVSSDLFNPEHPIYTKIKDEFPASYVGNGYAVNSVVADGCVIEGIVENSILFRGVHIRPGAVVRNSIIMQGGIVGEDSMLDSVIMDKNVNVLDNRQLSGYCTYPLVIRKGRRV